MTCAVTLVTCIENSMNSKVKIVTSRANTITFIVEVMTYTVKIIIFAVNNTYKYKIRSRKFI